MFYKVIRSAATTPLKVYLVNVFWLHNLETKTVF